MIDNSRGRGRGLVGRRRRPDALASFTDLDRRLLTLLCEERVLTQTQLERLHPDVPDRTLRYRTERLTRLGLVGRSRPYRDKGSAPFHYWPTRASDAFVRWEHGFKGLRQKEAPLGSGARVPCEARTGEHSSPST